MSVLDNRYTSSMSIPVATSSVVGRAAASYFAGRIAQVERGDLSGFADGLRQDTAQQVVTNVDLDTLVRHRLEAVGRGEGYTNGAKAMIGLRTTRLTPRLTHNKTDSSFLGMTSGLLSRLKWVTQNEYR